MKKALFLVKKKAELIRKFLDIDNRKPEEETVRGLLFHRTGNLEAE